MESKDTFLKAFPVVWIVTIVVGLLLWIFVTKEWGISFALGSLTALMTMSMLYKNSKVIVQSNNKEVAQKLAVRNYAFRMFFYALILVISGMLDSLEVIGTMIGLFSFKVIFYILVLFENRGEVHD